MITEAVSTCEVLLAVIGPRWLTATDQDGQRRLDDPDDIVRLEIQAALERNIRVIPILVEGAVMPRRRELPDSLVGLAHRNALSMRHESFRADADRLLVAIEPIMRAAGAPPVASGRSRVAPVAVDPADVVPLPRLIQAMEHDKMVNAVAFSPDGHLLAAVSPNKTVRVWEVAGGQERARATDDTPVVGVDFSPDGDLLATANSQNARVWELSSGQLRARTTVTHTGLVQAVVFSPDGRLLATASGDKTARVWEVASGQLRARVTHDTVVRDVVFSPDGRLLATASNDQTARVWALVR